LPDRDLVVLLKEKVGNSPHSLRHGYADEFRQTEINRFHIRRIFMVWELNSAEIFHISCSDSLFLAMIFNF
jgi:hypothetical protein